MSVVCYLISFGRGSSVRVNLVARERGFGDLGEPLCSVLVKISPRQALAVPLRIPSEHGTPKPCSLIVDVLPEDTLQLLARDNVSVGDIVDVVLDTGSFIASHFVWHETYH